MKSVIRVLLLLALLLSTAIAEIDMNNLRNRGPSGKLEGNVCMMVVFVSTPQHPWTDRDITNYYGTINNAISALDNEAARWGVNLHTQWMYYKCSLNYEVAKWPDTSVDWYWDLMKNFFYTENMTDLHEYLERKYNFDDTPFMFLFNTNGRCYSQIWWSNGWDGEFGVVFTKEPYLQRYAIIHELLHLYGAIDVYDYDNEGIQRITDRYYPEDLMRDSNCITVDGVNAYLIGWRNQMSDYASRFWNEIRYRR